MPISSASDAYNVFKMDVMSDCLSGYATHPKYEELCAEMLDACGVDASLFDLFEASLAPAERGNLVDMLDDLQLGLDFSDAWARYTELVWPVMEMVLDDLEITEGNHGPPIEHGCLHSCHIAITCVLCPPPSPTAPLPVESEVEAMDVADEGAQSTNRFDAKPLPALNEATLLTTIELLDFLPVGEREQARAYLSHQVGHFLTRADLPTRLATPMHAFERQSDGGDGTNCGRLCWRGAFARRRRGDFAACPALNCIVSSADPANGGKSACAGYLQIKRRGDGNHGLHGDERSKKGALLLLEAAGGTGYAQVNRATAAPQHVCQRTEKGYQCSHASHKKQPIASGSNAVLSQRLAYQVTVARWQANADATFVTAEGEVRLVDAGPLSAIRAGHAAFALGEPLQHQWGVSTGPSVASIAAKQPHGAVSATFMVSVASFADAMAQLSIWKAQLAALLARPESASVVLAPTTCFFFVNDERMAVIRSQCEAGSVLSASAEDCAAGGARRATASLRRFGSRHEACLGLG